MRGQEKSPHLGAAGDVDDRAPPAADYLEVPVPGGFVPRLARRRQDAQRRQVVIADDGVAVRNQGADQRWADAEDVDTVALNVSPQTIGTRMVGRTFVQSEGGTVGEHAGDLPGAHDPAHVGEPEQRVAWP